jgi:hypothetical protein
VKDNNLWTMQLDAQGKCPDPGTPPYASGPGDPKQLTGNQVTALIGGDDSWVGGWCNTPANHATNPNQEWIVFQRSAPPFSFEVYMQRIDSNRDAVGAPVNISGNNTASDSQPAVTPDCAKIAFHSSRVGTNASYNTAANSDVWVANFTGTGASGLTNMTDCSQAQESAPSWSPGTATGGGGTGSNYRIAFQTNRIASNDLEIYRMDAVDSTPVDGCGDNTTRLSYSGPSGGGGSSDLTGFDLVPSYSPDGSKICFHSGRAAEFRNTGASGIIGQWEIYVLDAAKGEPVVGANPDPTGSPTVRKTKRAGNDERCGWQEHPTL